MLAAAFPDRIAIKSRGKGANTFKLSGGGVASISVDHRDDPIAKAEALVICEMFGGNDRNGGKNDIIKLASPLTQSILTAAATMDENLKFCLNVSKQTLAALSAASQMILPPLSSTSANWDSVGLFVM